MELLSATLISGIVSVILKFLRERRLNKIFTQTLSLQPDPKTEIVGQIEKEAVIAGRMTIPNKVYVGEAQNISLEFVSQTFTLSEMKEQSPAKSLIEGDYLEIEMQAAGCKVAGDIKQKLKLIHGTPIKYHWNVVFEQSGTSQIKFIGRTSRNDLEVFNIEQTVKVLKFAGLTSRQLLIGTVISAVTAFVLGILQILQIVGYIPKTD